MDPIQKAIEDFESRGKGASFRYREVAKRFNISRATLARRHQHKCTDRAGGGQKHQNLSPQQEQDLVGYIEALLTGVLPPTREMIRNFGSSIAGNECSRRWVSRFLERNQDHLTSKWTSGIDRNRHQADSEYKYKLYFHLLHSKMQEYSIEPRNTYNMDEKGFLLGAINRSKRVFSKQLYARGEVLEAIQDGSREWITVLACICADGTVVPPAVIYPGKGALQSSWMEHLEVEKHQIFAATSPSGWSNDNLGLAWLEQVFERSTKSKARTFWRLLILDGHGSHVTMDFIEFCHANMVLLMVFPPHATHSLQPLDVVMFKSLSSFYSSELVDFLHNSQGLLSIKKRDFIPLF
jgi:hypothetical protein